MHVDFIARAEAPVAVHPSTPSVKPLDASASASDAPPDGSDATTEDANLVARPKTRVRTQTKATPVVKLKKDQEPKYGPSVLEDAPATTRR